MPLYPFYNSNTKSNFKHTLFKFFFFITLFLMCGCSIGLDIGLLTRMKYRKRTLFCFWITFAKNFFFFKSPHRFFFFWDTIGNKTPNLDCLDIFNFNPLLFAKLPRKYRQHTKFLTKLFWRNCFFTYLVFKDQALCNIRVMTPDNPPVIFKVGCFKLDFFY